MLKRVPLTRSVLLGAAIVAATGSLGHAQTDRPATDASAYRPALAVPESLQPFLEFVEPGRDAFTAEAAVAELEARLRELGVALRDRQAIAALCQRLLGAGFRGSPVAPVDEGGQRSDDALSIERWSGPAADGTLTPPSNELPPLDAPAFEKQLASLAAGLREVDAAEFSITAIEPGETGELWRTSVRYDIAGRGAEAWRIGHVGTWQMTWRKEGGSWRVVRWTTAAHVTSRARRPIFTEVTGAALGATESYRRQLGADLDAWMATLDSVLTRDSNGHHGVSVGDADGDGLDDLYVAQPAGLPNRLYRARGDSTFEDVTERAGLAVLDDTAQSLFADVDNDGDQDLVLSTGTRPLLFVNDGSGRFTNVPDAFRFKQPLQGVLTSISMADYDRDGFLDLYLCVYAYFFGAGDDKAGTPAPYHDARNGPPAVLFRNDGRGRFDDVTDETGLGAGNDRYHFAAAWADFDEDGWPDLLVANDFGTKNLYRNRGRRDGRVTFEDVAATAGVLDHGAGMSAAFLDYDNDGRLDIYTGNMWSANGLRVTASPAFMPDAPPEARALYRRHARGNSLFRNRGDGSFEEKTREAGVEMGRWAWSSDVVDFDSDGWDDIYIVNGMLTRRAGPRDLDGFFWRQVVARSPLTRAKGTPYDDAWRAINQLLIHESIASRQRNVLLRNDGRGRFDDVSGAVGLDLDQDGRSFAVLDVDRDGDPDLALMAARQAPQLRLFRNDFERRGASLAIRLTGTASNRDAIGARVRVETDRLRRTRVVQAGSGFISQGSKELIIGLGDSERVVSLSIAWPSGASQTFEDVPLNSRLRITEGGALEHEPFAPAPAPATTADRVGPASPPDATWLYEPFPAPGFSTPDLEGRTHSLAALRGRPAVLLFWSAASPSSRSALDALARGRRELAAGGAAAIAIALDEPAQSGAVRAAAPPGLPVIHAPQELAFAYAIMYRHIFMNRQPLRIPSTLLLDGSGQVVKVYRGTVEASRILADIGTIDASPAERLQRAVPFAGTLVSPLPIRNYLPYGRELLDQGLEAAALAALERAAQANPTAFTLYRLGTLLAKRGDVPRARATFERALALQPDLAEASNDLGALLAQQGDLEAAMERFRAALAATPEYPDALNNLGYALLLAGQNDEARTLYEKALALQPDFPEALNNLGLLLGRGGDLQQAERYFRQALERRRGYGEAANNLALVLVSRGDPDAAVRTLEGLITHDPAFEGAYVTLAKIHLSAGRTPDGLRVLEQLLQRNPTHPVALELVREWRGR